MRLEVPDELLDQIAAEVASRVLARLAERDSKGDGWPAWMSPKQAAEYIGATEERIRNLLTRGVLPYSQEAPGCRVAISRQALDALHKDWET